MMVKKEKEKDYGKPSVFYVMRNYFKKFFGSVWNYISAKVKSFFSFLGKFKTNLLMLIKFLLIVFAYGFIINYAFRFVVGVQLNIYTIPAWGVLYYLLAQEFPEWFRKLIKR